MQEQAVLPTFSKKKVGRRKGGMGRQRRCTEWLSPRPKHQHQHQHQHQHEPPDQDAVKNLLTSTLA